MKKIIIIALMLMIPSIANAGHVGKQTITRFFGSDTIAFGVEGTGPAGTCKYFSYHFKFDATTESGKNLFAILLSAHAKEKPINIWYTESSAPGTTQVDGCNWSSMATVTKIGW